MNRKLRNLTVGGLSALAAMSVATISANAFYTGYGNGDPGGWDLWTEARGGAPAPASHHAYAGSGHESCGYLHHKALQTGAQSWWHRYHACKNG